VYENCGPLLCAQQSQRIWLDNALPYAAAGLHVRARNADEKSVSAQRLQTGFYINSLARASSGTSLRKRHELHCQPELWLDQEPLPLVV
jgi:hypothetical protein